MEMKYAIDGPTILYITSTDVVPYVHCTVYMMVTYVRLANDNICLVLTPAWPRARAWPAAAQQQS